MNTMNYFYVQHSAQTIWYGEEKVELLFNPDFTFIGRHESPKMKLVVVQMLKNMDLPLSGWALRPVSKLGENPDEQQHAESRPE